MTDHMDRFDIIGTGNDGQPATVLRRPTTNPARVWYGEAADAYAAGRADEREAVIEGVTARGTVAAFLNCAADYAARIPAAERAEQATLAEIVCNLTSAALTRLSEQLAETGRKTS